MRWLVEQHVSLALEVADKVIVIAHDASAVSGAAKDVLGGMDLVRAAYLEGATS